MKKFEKWAEYKAYEPCYGKENMELYHLKSKKGMKECFGMPVPEIGLYEMAHNSPYRMVHEMLKGAKEMESMKMMKMMMMMKAKMGMGGMGGMGHGKQNVVQNHAPVAYIPYPAYVQQQQPQSTDMMMKMM